MADGIATPPTNKPAAANSATRLVDFKSPHSARHVFVSTLQAKGIEVGLVAKLAGHSNATVTLTHYTQAVRGGEAAIQALEEAYIEGDIGQNDEVADQQTSEHTTIVDRRPAVPTADR